MPIYPFSHPSSGAVVFGPGCSDKAAAQGPLKKAQKILVVTDVGVQRAGVLDTVLAPIGSRAVLVETGVVPDGDVAWTDALASRAKEAGVDGILAIGGGSVIDSAKGVGAVLATGKPLASLEGIATVRAKLLPFAAVPTTSGTGSESTQFAVIKDRQEMKKRVYMDTSLMPAMSFLDPTLLVALPRPVTCATGVDALTHAIEALASKMRNPVGTALAAEAIRLLVVERALERAIEKGDDVDARGMCLVAANLAGQAVSTSMLGAVHAFAHALGAHKGIAHGVGNGLFLVPVMEKNAEKAAGPYGHLARILGKPDIKSAIEEIARVVHTVAGIPHHLGEVGITVADVRPIAALASADPDLPTNPVAFDEAAVLALVEARL